MKKDKKESFVMFLLRTFAAFIMWLIILPIFASGWFNILHQWKPNAFKNIDVSRTHDFIVMIILDITLLNVLYLIYKINW
jgi:hypothetical protein